MLTIKLIILVFVLLSLAILGISIKIIFQKDAKLPNTSCKAIGSTLQQRGVSSCKANTATEKTLPKIEVKFKNLEQKKTKK